MKLVLLVEGYTEKKAVREFLRRWLDARLSQRVGIQVVRFEGWTDFRDEAAKKAKMHLAGPGANQVIGVAGMLDLYGPTFYPEGESTARQRTTWGTGYFEKQVDDPRFRMFFAVHEVEAWLLSQPEIFPPEVRKALPGKVKDPESVNFDQPPAKLLERLYVDKLKRKYKKVTDGYELFGRLKPETAYDKCPALRELLDWMLARAQSCGL